MTNKMWPWKLESSKECVTTHCSNEVTPKMNGDQPYNRYSTDKEDPLNNLYLVGLREN